MNTVTIALVNCYPRKDDMHWLARRKNILDAFTSYIGLPGRYPVLLQHVSIRFDDLLSPSTMAELESADGVIVPGSPLNVSAMDGDMPEKLFLEALEVHIKDSRVPVFGICFGHQLAGHAFGCKVGKYAAPGTAPAEKDTVGILRVDPGFELLRRFPGYRDRHVDVSVEWKHQEEVKISREFDRQFTLFASTPACKIQAMKHVNKQIYGVQFHPETRKDDILANGRSPRQDGQIILHGFIDIVVDSKTRADT
jgi:GMP synthase-like glutamine amidotransferase